MKKAIVSFYVYLICFVTVSCAVIFLGAGVYNVIEIAAPGYMLSAEIVQDHRDNQSFIHSHYKSNLYEYLTDMQITTQRIESLEGEIVNERNSAIRGLIIVFVVLIINMGVFYLHWPIVERRQMGHSH